MVVLSKLVGQHTDAIIHTYNCYEVAHTWTPYCSQAFFDLMRDGFIFSLKTYAPLYLATTFMHSPNPLKVNYGRLALNIGRSSLMLSTNAYMFIFFICAVRRSLGFWVYPTIGLVNGIMAAFCAILIERKKRRPMLALYLTNLASEVTFRMCVHRGYITPVPKGQVLVFAAAMAGYMNLLARDELDDGLAKLFRFVYCIRPARGEGSGGRDLLPESVVPAALQRLLTRVRQCARPHRLCEHAHSCQANVLESFVRNGAIGLGVSSALNLLGSLSKLRSQPAQLLRSLFTYRNMQIPLLMGAMPAIYQSIVCLAHHAYGVDSARVHTLAGGCSGLALLFYPNISIAMYALWKYIEIMTSRLIDAGYLPVVPHGHILLYSLSTGWCLFAGVMEPHTLRPGYWKFLMGLTGGRFAEVHRKMLDIYGTESSKLFGDFRPNLDPLHCSWNPVLSHQPK